MSEATAGRLRRDVSVTGVVSGGHFMSHYYAMMLPPLFPLLHNDLGVSYTLLGLLLSLKALASGSLQLPLGILVDKYGARVLLLGGFSTILVAFFLVSLSHSFWIIAALFILAGIGNSVFHPADYSILNGTVDGSRIGRAFSAHTFSGHLGTALAPVTILFMIEFFGLGWRGAVMASVAMGLVIVIGLLSQWSLIQEGDARIKKKKQTAMAASPDGVPEQTTLQAVIEVVKSRPMLFLFLFFGLQMLATGAFKNFAVASLVVLHDTSLSAAGGALTGFLFASAFGVLAGGVLADWNKRHALTASICLLLTAVIAVLVASIDLHYTVLVAVFCLAGWVQGMIRPARDMMIRAASPKGSVGKSYGFVFSGQAIGGTIAPVVFGFMLDMGAAGWVFYTSAIFLVICMFTVLASAREDRLQRERAGQSA